jgi:ferrous iron transport protein A
MPEGSEVEIVGVHGGRGLVRQLTEMGFTNGSSVKVLRNHRGPVLVEVKGSRVAIGHGLAMKMMVKPIEDDN